MPCKASLIVIVIILMAWLSKFTQKPKKLSTSEWLKRMKELNIGTGKPD